MTSINDKQIADKQIADNPISAPLPFTAIPGAELDTFIRARAYELYEQAGRQDGHAEEHWHQAQSEILGSSTTGQVRL